MAEISTIDHNALADLLEAADVGCGSALAMMESGMSTDIEADRARLARWQKAMNTVATEAGIP